MERNNIIPSLFVKTKGESSAQVALKLTTAKQKCIVRITGGCGYMSTDDSDNLIQTFVEAFVDYQGAMLFGGTRMLDKQTKQTINGITEVAPAIKKQNPDVVVLGVIAKSDCLGISEQGLIVSNNNEDSYFTICHPGQDMTLLVQKNPDIPMTIDSSIWDMEYQECMSIVRDLREFAGMQSLLICYNGGNTTEKELLATAREGWPVLLIKGSGRISDVYASDTTFLEQYPSVSVCENNAYSLQETLNRMSIVPSATTKLKIA